MRKLTSSYPLTHTYFKTALGSFIYNRRNKTTQEHICCRRFLLSSEGWSETRILIFRRHRDPLLSTMIQTLLILSPLVSAYLGAVRTPWSRASSMRNVTSLKDVTKFPWSEENGPHQKLQISVGMKISWRQCESDECLNKEHWVWVGVHWRGCGRDGTHLQWSAIPQTQWTCLRCLQIRQGH